MSYLSLQILQGGPLEAILSGASDTPNPAGGSGSAGSPPDITEAVGLLRLDLEHYGKELARNDGIGEARFRFFATLVTAVAGWLVTLWKTGSVQSSAIKTDQFMQNEQSMQIASGATWFLFIIGILTYLRMLKRNKVTDRIKDNLDHIRGLYVEILPKLKEINYHITIPKDRKMILPSEVSIKWLRSLV